MPHGHMPHGHMSHGHMSHGGTLSVSFFDSCAVVVLVVFVVVKHSGDGGVATIEKLCKIE